MKNLIEAKKLTVENLTVKEFNALLSFVAVCMNKDLDILSYNESLELIKKHTDNDYFSAKFILETIEDCDE